MQGNNTMTIVLNGEERLVAGTVDIASLVMELGLAGKAVAVAVNRRVVRSSAWPGHALAEGDKVDIVRAIGGG